MNVEMCVNVSVCSRESERKLLGDKTEGSDSSDEEFEDEYKPAEASAAGSLVAQSAGAVATAVSAVTESIQPTVSSALVSCR